MAKQKLKTQDGVLVEAGDTVWLARDQLPQLVVQEQADGTLLVPSRGRNERHPFYSTRQAARAARLHELRINLAAIEQEIRQLQAEADASHDPV